MIAIGTRVQIPAFTDAWMRGDRYGEVIGHVRNRRVTVTGYRDHKVKMDKSGKVYKFSPDNLRSV